ncbi:MAG: P-loop NTPase fold protein [Desulfomonilaceae bacterium]|nr:P-loop NTPase fold protein [Desulfomonilaceae bacterium]
MAGEEKKGLFGRLFRRKSEVQEHAPPEPEDSGTRVAASEPVLSEDAGHNRKGASEEPLHEPAVSHVPSIGEEKTDVVELEMDIPEHEISTVALSLKDLEAAAAREGAGRDLPSPEEKDEKSFADVELETAEIDGTMVIKIDRAEFEAGMTHESGPIEISADTDTVESPSDAERAAVPITLEDVEADLTAEDTDDRPRVEIDLDLDEDEEPNLREPFQTGGIEDERTEAGKAASEGAPITDQAAAREVTETEQREIVLDEDEEPDFRAAVENDEIESTSRELADSLGFPEFVTQDEDRAEHLTGSVVDEDSLSRQPAIASAPPADLPSPQGLGDAPLETFGDIEHGLGIQNLAEALSTFVMNCRTPMRICVQGPSGSGKTSLMNLVAADADLSQCVTARFAARDYSRLRDTGEMPALLIRRILHAVERIVPEDKVGLIRQRIEEALPLVDRLWRTGLFADTGIPASIEIDENEVSPTADAGIDAVTELKAKFREIVRQGLQLGAAGRIVVFVDDLDRVDPVQAMDILETIGAFPAIEGCIFVVACDPAVVERGIQAAFPSVGTTDTARAYFERAFQISVSLPSPVTRLDELVTELLGAARLNYSEETVKTAVPLVRLSIGMNPRRIKRLANRLVFAHAIDPEFFLDRDIGSHAGQLNQKMLLALGCLEDEYGPVFRLLSSTLSDDRELISLIDERLRDVAQIMDLHKAHGLLGEGDEIGDRGDKLLAFMDLFVCLLYGGDPAAKLDRESLRLLKQGIDLISATSTVPAELSDEDAVRSALNGFRLRVKERLKQILPGLAPDASDTSIRSWPSARPWFGFWYTDDVTKKAWGPRRLFYEVSFDAESRYTVSVGLHCNASRLPDFGVDRETIDRLKTASTLRERNFEVSEYDTGRLEIVKVLHECSCNHVDEVNDDEAASVAEELKELVLATHAIFDLRPPLKVLRPDTQQVVRRSIPPCKACGSELREVTTKDGSVGFRCDACRKVYIPKTSKADR